MIQDIVESLPMWKSLVKVASGWQLVSNMTFVDGSLIQFWVTVRPDGFVISDLGDHDFIAGTMLCDFDDAFFQHMNEMHSDSLAKFENRQIRVEWLEGYSPYEDFEEAFQFGLQDALSLVLHFSFKCRERRWLAAQNEDSQSNGNLLMIENDGHVITNTNFWDPDAPLQNAVYLSQNAGVLRLLLPISHVENYLSDFINAKFVEICPTSRADKPDFVDIVFVDGTKDPFSFAIHLDAHADIKPVDGECALIVYCGSLEKQLKLPAIVRLDALQKEPYFVQVTKNTR